MYNPKGNGVEKAVQSVQFREIDPPEPLRDIVHKYLDIKTSGPLTEDYRFHALPDACTYIIFDQIKSTVAGVSKLRASSEELNLGTDFHYVNIRFLPGVWQDRADYIAPGMVQTAYLGDLPLIEVNAALSGRDFEAKTNILSGFVESLVTEGLVVANPVTKTIFQNIDAIRSVADIAAICNLSTRQLQRTLKRTTGFSPHDFLKVLRLQQTLSGKDISDYADQAHFIHSFRKATGYTPNRYAQKFDV